MDDQSLLEENDVQMRWAEAGHPDEVLSRGMGCTGCLGATDPYFDMAVRSSIATAKAAKSFTEPTQGSTDPYFDMAVRSSIATAKAAKSFTEPTQGSKPIWFEHISEALKAVQKGMTQYSKTVQEQTALELMKRQQQGQQNYLPQKVVEKVRREQTGWSTETKVLVGVGAGLLGLAFLMSVTRRPKRAASVLPAPARRALPEPKR